MTKTDVESKREVEWTEELVSTKIGELTANLIRISRGCGKLYEVETQVMDLAELFAKHRSITSHGVSPHIFAEALSFEPEISNEDRERAGFQRVRIQIVKGALQLAASEILGQNTFKHSGETELLEGQRHWEELRRTRKYADNFGAPDRTLSKKAPAYWVKQIFDSLITAPVLSALPWPGRRHNQQWFRP